MVCSQGDPSHWFDQRFQGRRGTRLLVCAPPRGHPAARRRCQGRPTMSTPHRSPAPRALAAGSAVLAAAAWAASGSAPATGWGAGLCCGGLVLAAAAWRALRHRRGAAAAAVSAPVLLASRARRPRRCGGKAAATRAGGSAGAGRPVPATAPPRGLRRPLQRTWPSHCRVRRTSVEKGWAGPCRRSASNSRRARVSWADARSPMESSRCAIRRRTSSGRPGSGLA